MPYCSTCTFSKRDEAPLAIILSSVGKQSLILASVSTISTTIGRSNDSRSTLAGCSLLERPKPHRASNYCRSSNVHFTCLQHDGFVNRITLESGPPRRKEMRDSIASLGTFIFASCHTLCPAVTRGRGALSFS